MNYLVFVCDDSLSGYEREREPHRLESYTCIGGVSAPDVPTGAQAVISAIRRVPKLAFVEAQFIDFAAEVNAPEGQRVQLNP